MLSSLRVKRHKQGKEIEQEKGLNYHTLIHHQSKLYFCHPIDSGTNERIIVVVGGWGLMNSKDTELLINGKWQKGM